MRKNIAIFALLMGASIASAQTMKIHLSDGTTATYPAERVNYVEFIEDDTPGGNGYDNGHEYVDLGLPSGLLWATCNVGASSPEDYGDYFAWGETSTKSKYNWSTYFDTTDGGNTFQKYNNNGGKTVLDLSDDAAHVNWGGSWRMPTFEEQEELMNECTWEWTTQNGVNGRKVTGPNGNSLFLPAAGCCNNSSLGGEGLYGEYWLSSLFASDSSDAFYLIFNSNYESMMRSDRFYGQPVRPVR